jgi:hypothetical protein
MGFSLRTGPVNACGLIVEAAGENPFLYTPGFLALMRLASSVLVLSPRALIPHSPWELVSDKYPHRALHWARPGGTHLFWHST